MAFRSRNPQVGDQVFVLFGGTMPFLLRVHDLSLEHFRLVGDCYLQGILDGEAMGQIQLM